MQALAIAFVACSWSPPAGAQSGTKEQCLSAYSSAQDLRQQGHLLDAREKLLICARQPCPAVLRTDCSSWLSEVQKLLPSIVLGAHRPAGPDWVDVTVRLDGAVLTRRLDGKAIAVDPGEHLLSFDVDGQSTVQEHVVIREGEKARDIVVTIGGPLAEAQGPAGRPPAEAQGSASQPPGNRPREASNAWTGAAPWFAGTAAVALGVFAYFAVAGLSRWDHCHQGGCSASDRSFVDTQWIGADVALGVGAVATGITAYLYLSRPRSGPPARVSAAPVRGGGLIVMDATF
jgi:hypothetical protein